MADYGLQEIITQMSVLECRNMKTIASLHNAGLHRCNHAVMEAQDAPITDPTHLHFLLSSILYLTISHTDSLWEKAATGYFGGGGRCQVLLEYEIGISISAVGRRKHEEPLLYSCTDLWPGKAQRATTAHNTVPKTITDCGNFTLDWSRCIFMQMPILLFIWTHVNNSCAIDGFVT